MPERCRWSDLPVDQCACHEHRDEHLPAGVEPEVRRGVTPYGKRVWPPAGPEREPRATRDRHAPPKPLTTCRWGEGGWMMREHVRDCASNTCQGCKACPKTHCAMRGKCPNHVEAAVNEVTCPQCIGRTRADLDQIEDILALLPTEAQDAGVNSEALNIIGPAVTPEQSDARRRLDDSGRGWCDYPRAVDDPQHPYAVLGYWDMALRETYGPHTDLFITVSRAADYLRGLLAGEFPHTAEFEPFAGTVAKCRSHLEEVLRDSRKPETGAPCPKCADAIEAALDGRKAPRLIKRHDTSDRSGASDRWSCPDVPEHSWKEADYRLRVSGDYLARAEKLTSAQIGQQYGIPSGTIRRWASADRKLVDGERTEVAPRLAPVGRTDRGVRLYRVADVLALRADDPSDTDQSA